MFDVTILDQFNSVHAIAMAIPITIPDVAKGLGRSASSPFLKPRIRRDSEKQRQPPYLSSSTKCSRTGADVLAAENAKIFWRFAPSQ
uniref:Uncharacterized protein n=1 Tax=Romanomermis culicivorax TaxID=13658 RepID=A0A915JMF8_ROMCU